LQEVARQADAVCFGSLSQRTRVTRITMRYFLAEMRPNALCVFDVNLCPDCCAAEVIGESLRFADIVKLNNEEVQKSWTSCLFSIRAMNPPHFVDAASRATEHPGYPAPVADTIGAGDAFTAMTMDRYLRGATPEEISDSSNRVGRGLRARSAPPPQRMVP